MIDFLEDAPVGDDERNRLRSKKALLLTLLSDGEWHSNRECLDVAGLSYNVSVFGLRSDGYRIESRPLGDGLWEYRLTGKTAPRQKRNRRSMSGPQRDVAEAYAEAIRATVTPDEALTVLSAVPLEYRLNSSRESRFRTE